MTDGVNNIYMPVCWSLCVLCVYLFVCVISNQSASKSCVICVKPPVNLTTCLLEDTKMYFLVAWCLQMVQETKLWSRDQEASSSAVRNSGLFWKPCYEFKCVPNILDRPSVSFVMNEFWDRVIKITSMTSLSFTCCLFFWFHLF